MLSKILRKIVEWVEKIQYRLVKWEMERMIKRLGPPAPNMRKLEVDEIDMGNMGRWQGLDDQRRPDAHTTVNVGTYLEKQ